MPSSSTHQAKPGQRVFASLPAKYTTVGPTPSGGSPAAHSCVARSVSLGRVLIESDECPPVGMTIHLSIARLGAWPARVSERLPGGFAAVLEIRGPEAEKLALRLEWLKRHYKHEAANRRTKERFAVPPFTISVRTQTGEVIPATLFDISASGAGIQTAMRPGINTRLSVNGIPGKVARYFDGGLGVHFDSEYTLADLKKMLLNRPDAKS